MSPRFALVKLPPPVWCLGFPGCANPWAAASAPTLDAKLGNALELTDVVGHQTHSQAQRVRGDEQLVGADRNATLPKFGMSGTVMAVLDITRPAMESMQRRWPSSGRGFELTDMNREWPSNENGLGAVSRQAGLVFNRLLKPNTDLAIDFHTGALELQTPPVVFPVFSSDQVG